MPNVFLFHQLGLEELTFTEAKCKKGKKEIDIFSIFQ
jgi:hypothetical protein